MPSSSVHVIEYESGTDRSADSALGAIAIALYDGDGAVVDLSGGSHALALTIEPYPGATNETETGISVAGTATGATLTILNTCVLTAGEYLLTIIDTNTDTVPEPDVITVTCYPLAGPIVLRVLPART